MVGPATTLVSLVIILISSCFAYETTSVSLRGTGYLSCEKSWKCYGTSWCHRNEQCLIRPGHLSQQTCFKQMVNFTMGTSEPIFRMDGEGPPRLVELDPFCIDQTEVSNLQFSLFVQETNYISEVSICLTLVVPYSIASIFQLNVPRLNCLAIRWDSLGLWAPKSPNRSLKA